MGFPERLDSSTRPDTRSGTTTVRGLRRDERGRFLPAGRMRHGGGQQALFVTSEMADFLKAGGLGDVAAALPRALRASCDVRILIPGYPAVLRHVGDMPVVGQVDACAGLPACTVGEAVLEDGLVVYVLLNPALYEREGSPYVDRAGQDWADNAIRFATLSRAAAEIAGGRAGLDWRPGVLHLNDWPTAMAAAYAHWQGDDTPSLLTVHNLAYQGLFPHDTAASLGIPSACMVDVEFHGHVSFLLAGLAHASHINTVSATYAREITTHMHGCGLDRLLARRAAAGRLSGILNGIDGAWNPRTTPHLQAHFGVGDWAGKRANARQVRRELGLPESTGPLFAVVSRLVHQKGIDLVCEVVPQIVAAGGQVVFIGNGEPNIERAVQALARRYPAHVGAWIGFEEPLARRIFAGADFLLMPSRFEPCGLSQMYAQRFGCLPIVHATGGLADTVEDGVTGFHCPGANVDALRRAVERAFRVHRLPRLLEAMRRAAMLAPCGWETAARRYLAHYEAIARTSANRTAAAA
jgi:starch synthase